MWHEARKQERILKSMMVDHRRRAERRREYYEKSKGDPSQFLQVHGRQQKIHLDPMIAAAADSPATMMPWQGQADILIDRFDVRAHLDVIPLRPKKTEEAAINHPDEEIWEERQASYERYRILVQNEFIGVSEEKFLHQIYIEEQFGPVQKIGEEEKKKMLAPKKATIQFTYEDSTPSSSAGPALQGCVLPPEATEEEESDSDIDLDLSISVDQLTTEQMHEMNKCALHYGLGRQDFMSLLTKDLDEQESARIAKEEEQERAMYSGRKARKERRAFREQRLQALLMNRCMSPPSYATRKSPTYADYGSGSRQSSESRSPSPEGGIKFITSFGDDSDTAGKKGTSRNSPNKPREKGRSNRKWNKESENSTASSKKDKSGSNTQVSSRVHHSKRSRSPVSRKRSRSPAYRRDVRQSRRSSSHSRSFKSSRRNKDRSSSRHRRHSSSSSSTSSSRSRSPPASSSRHWSPPTSTSAVPPPAPIRRYYGRQRSNSDSSISDKETSAVPAKPSHASSKNTTHSVAGSSHRNSEAGGSKSGPSSTPHLTPQERLKRKMQLQLNKQYKADKRAEKEKLQKVEQEKSRREEEMRELALRLRRKERMRRHAAKEDSEDSDSSHSRSPLS